MTDETNTAEENTTDETFLTIAEAAEYTGRSVAWLKKDENKEALLAGGAVFGGRGQASKIPLALIDSLFGMGEKKERKPRKAKVSGNTDVEGLLAEIADLEASWVEAKEAAATLGAIIKQKRSEVAKTAKAAEREQAKLLKQKHDETNKARAAAAAKAAKAAEDLKAAEEALAALDAQEAAIEAEEAAEGEAEVKEKKVTKPRKPKAAVFSDAEETPAEEAATETSEEVTADENESVSV